MIDMNIGDTVRYIRHNEQGVSEGTAILTGIGLDGDKRVIVLLREGEKSFNTSFACINPSPEFCERFSAHAKEIENLAKEGNAKAKAIIDDYNARISALNDSVVGAALNINLLTEPKGETI